MTLLFAFLIGILVGLRSLTPPAVTAWAARLGWLRLSRPLSFIGKTPAVVVFTLAALLELAVDKMPSAASRTAPPGLVARIVMGGLAGACVASAGGQGFIVGSLLGVVGALAGTFGGYQVRTRLVKALGTPDYVVAVLEDLVAIAGSVWVVTRF